MTDMITKRPKRVRPKSRPQRWADAASKASTAIADLRNAADAAIDAMGELKDLQDEYSDWKESLPDNLQYSGPLAEKLDEVVNLDIESALDELTRIADDAESVVEEAAGLDLPRGFGRD